jgi:hypothetical protein
METSHRQEVPRGWSIDWTKSTKMETDLAPKL